MIRGDNLVVRVRADVKQFMDDMRSMQHATYDSVRAIKALNVTAGGDLNKLLNSTIRNTISFATNAAKSVIGDALQAIAFEENNQMALAALAEYRMKNEALINQSTQRVKIGEKILTVEQQLAALEKRRLAAENKEGAAATLDQINWLNDIKRLQTDIQQSENGIIRAREKLADTTKQVSASERERLNLQIQEYQEKINDITTYQIPKAQEKLRKSGYNPFQPTEDQVDWDAMAAQIIAGGDKAVAIFADQAQGLTQQNIAEIKKKAEEESRATMEVLSTMAIKSPFSRKEIVEGYGTLIRMGGISFEQGKEMMQQIVDIQSVTGKGNKGIQAMTLAVGKILATGRLNGDAVNQLVKTAGIPVWEILAKSTGKQVAELQKMMRANKLSAEIVMPALQDYMKDFAGKAAEEAGTFVGLINSISDLKDAVYVDFFAPIGESLKRPFADLVDMITGGPFRQSIRDAGQFIAANIAEAIDFIYRSVEKFRLLGNATGNPFIRFIVILKDAAKEFGVDTSGLIKYTETVEKIFNWAYANKDELIAAANGIKDFFLVLVGLTSLTSVLGKISMFITGFLASPVGLLSAALTGLYFAWKYNVGGIADWVSENQESIKNFLLTIYDTISTLIRALPYLNFDKLLDNLKKFKLISEDLYDGLKNLSTGITYLDKSIEESGKGNKKGAAENFVKSNNAFMDTLFSGILEPEFIGNSMDVLLQEINTLLDPVNNADLLVGIGFAVGNFLENLINWIVDLWLNLTKPETLSNLWTTIGAVAFSLVETLFGFIVGAFGLDSLATGDMEALSNSVVGWLGKLLSGLAGSIIGFGPVILYDIVGSIVWLIDKIIQGILFVINFFTTKRSKEETAKVEKDINRLAELVFVEPFKHAFSGERAQEIAKFFFESIKYFQFLIVNFLNVSGGLSVIEVQIWRMSRKAAGQIAEALTELFLVVYRVQGVSSEELEARRAELRKKYVEPVEKFFDDTANRIVEARKKAIEDLKKELNITGEAPTAPNLFGFGKQVDANFEVKPNIKEGPGFFESITAWFKGSKTAIEESVNDPEAIKQRQLEVVYQTVPHFKRASPESILREFSNVNRSAMDELTFGLHENKTLNTGVFQLQIPVYIKPIILPETGGDFTTDLRRGVDNYLLDRGDEAAQRFNASNLFKKITGFSTADAQNYFITGVTEAMSGAARALAQANMQDSVAYKDVGVPQGAAVSAGVEEGLKGATNAVAALDDKIKKIPEESLPNLTKSFETWKIDMTTKVAPEIDTVRTTVVDPLAKSFDGVTSAVERLNDKILILAERLKGIQIPPQLQANSPTPFEMGLRGIAKATDVLNKQNLPKVLSVEQKQANINTGGNFGRQSNINLVVKVGEKEVAGVVAVAVAGEIKKMIYKDSLRG